MNFKIGSLYSVDEIQQNLQVGNAGGIRVSLCERRVQRIVLLTAVPSAKILRENPYYDRVEGDVLVYSAGGLEGDQSLSGVNKRLVYQKNELFPIYGFRLNESRRKGGAKRWEFIGLLQFLRVYPDTQIDRNGNIRRIWLFEFRICVAVQVVETTTEKAAMQQAVSDFTFDLEKEARVDLAEPLQAPRIDRQEAEAIERARATIFSLDPRSFEELVKRALEATGFSDVNVTRYTQDNGIDVNAQVSDALWPLTGLRVQVQAKRWLHTVGRREIAELRGSLDPFAQGAVVSTSFFSRAAIAEAKTAGRQPIVLVDGYQFATTVRKHSLVQLD